MNGSEASPPDEREDRPLRVADGIYWVGYSDEDERLRCNPYLVVEKDRAVLIDGGSRGDFAGVMTKILQAGIDPRQIEALIYQHYDPDLAGSMANLIDICENPDLCILTNRRNEAFLGYYLHASERRRIHTFEELGNGYALGDRKLSFIDTPYAHAPGSFVTYDGKTRTLFSSDLFGSFSTEFGLFLDLQDVCLGCADWADCPLHRVCPLPEIVKFHRTVMPSTAALRHAMEKIRSVDVEILAPQHGSVIVGKRDVGFVIDMLASLSDVGIDGVLSGSSAGDPSPGGDVRKG